MTWIVQVGYQDQNNYGVKELASMGRKYCQIDTQRLEMTVMEYITLHKRVLENRALEKEDWKH